MAAMAHDYTTRSTSSQRVRFPFARRRRMRLLAGLIFIFVVGVGLGVVLGNWLASPETPTAQMALKPLNVPYEVPARAYRPPLRNTQRFLPPPPAQPPVQVPVAEKVAPAPVVPAPRVDAVAKVETRETEPAPRAPSAPPEPAIATRIDRGKTPMWLANAAAAPASDGRPMIALVIDDLGLSQTRARRTIALPAPLTLAFLPYGSNLSKLADASRLAGHELIIHVNMEPKDHDVDPGPKALLTSLNADEVRNRLEWALTRFDGYIGISNHMGSRFTEWPDGMEAVVRVLKRRGLLFFDSVTSTKSVGAALARAHGLAHASRDIFLDHDRDAAAVARQLAQTERIARRRGYAIAIGHPYDVTFDALKAWIPGAIKRGFVMVPLSAIVRRQRGEG